MKLPGTILGSALAVAVSGGFVLALGALPPPTDLSLELDTPRAFVVDDSGRPRMSHAELLERAETRDLPSGDDPGLHLRTWHLDYLHRWEREITVPILSGPLAEEGSDVCGFSLRVAAHVFQTSNKAAGIKALVKNRIAATFPFDFEKRGVKIHFPSLRDVDLRIGLLEGLVYVYIKLTLIDETKFTASALVRLSRNEFGAPIAQRVGNVSTEWTGPTHDSLEAQAAELGAEGGGLFGALLGCFIAGPAGCLLGGGAGAAVGSEQGKDQANEEGQKQTEELIRDQLDDALGKLTLSMARLTEPFAPFSTRPNDKVALSLGGNPSISPSGLVLPLCLKVRIGGTKRDDSVKGPVISVANFMKTPSAPDTNDADLELIADANGLNQILYLLWQSGTLREVGQSSAILDVLPESFRALAFDVTGFDPGLPPTVMPSSESDANGLTVVLGDVSLGTWDRRRVVGHAVTTLGLDEREGIELSAFFQHVTVNCTEWNARSRTVLTPCLSDLLPTVREMLHEKPLVRRFAGGDLLRRLPELTFSGLKIEPSNLRANTTSSPASLRLRVDTKIVTAPAQ